MERIRRVGWDVAVALLDGGVEAEELGDGDADTGEGEGCAEPGEEGTFFVVLISGVGADGKGRMGRMDCDKGRGSVELEGEEEGKGALYT